MRAAADRDRIAAARRVRQAPASAERPAHRRRRLTPAQRRDQIVRGAIAFFTERGFAGTTRELSERIGITQPLLYKYFKTKRDLVEAVYAEVYLGRLQPHWPRLVRNRRLPVRERMTTFYHEYANAILTREWLRLFLFAGLEGEDLNRRYLQRLGTTIIEPLHAEITQAIRRKTGKRSTVPSLDDLWVHHGGIFYLGVREHIYGLPATSDRASAITNAIDRFLRAYGL